MTPIYLDYQATTPTDPAVVEAMMPFFTDSFANPASANKLSLKINKDIEESRHILANSINAKTNEIVFTSGATESINLAFKGLLDTEKSGHIITLKTEHSAVLNTCRYLENKGFCITYLDVNQDGLIDLSQLESSITSETKLVSVMHVNNEIGIIQPIEEIGAICKKHNIPFFVDAAQSYGKIPIDVQQMNISMLSISGHKIYAPKGIGFLYINSKLMNKVTPLIHGGGQEFGLRSGTLNVPSIIGLAKATDISMNNIPAEQERILQLRACLLNQLQKNLSNLRVNGSMKNRIAGNLNLSFENISGDVLINQLAGLIVSRGSACNSSKTQGSHVLKAMGLPADLIDSAIRISIGRYTTQDDINLAANKITATVNNILKISNI